MAVDVAKHSAFIPLISDPIQVGKHSVFLPLIDASLNVAKHSVFIPLIASPEGDNRRMSLM